MADFLLGNPGRIFASKDYSVNGDCSLKATPDIELYSVNGISFSFENGNRYLLEACCLNKVSGASMEIRDDSGDALFRVYLPVTSNFHRYSLEFMSTGIESKIIFRTYNSENSLYVDNIRLINL